MKSMNAYIGALLLAAAIVAPALVVAEAQAQEEHVTVRVYDRHHKDYHNWDDREDHAYRGYLGERHQGYREYNQQTRRNQDNYWRWRHQHPDHEENRER
jgi:hypothetical protein